MTQKIVAACDVCVAEFAYIFGFFVDGIVMTFTRIFESEHGRAEWTNKSWRGRHCVYAINTTSKQGRLS